MMTWTAKDGIFGDSQAMRALNTRVERVARSDLPVLINGETGTGKELVARAIHARSPRRDGPFVSENCAALSESLLDAELFGHESGSFTGAHGSREGLIARAAGGTLFIDEVADMSDAMQSKLLRVLQEGEVRRVGGDRTRRVDVRVIAATNVSLEQLVASGRFRQDLLFRLAVLEVNVPALRDRLGDIPLLANQFLRQVCSEENRPPLAMGDQALDRLLTHDWPGNVRELENAIRVGALFSNGRILEAESLPIHPSLSRSGRAPDEVLSYSDLLDRLEGREREFVLGTIAQARGNKAEAARRLGITRYALYRTMKRLGIDKDDPLQEQGSEERQLVGV